MSYRWWPVTEPKMSIYEFGERLLGALDLDPVYIIAHEAKMERSELQHWLLAYFCFYHVGTASWITEGGKDYWTRMEQAAGSKDWPRSAERRHFRGENARKSVAYLKSKGVAELFKPFQAGKSYSIDYVMAEVQKWVGFGPWIAFKVADMLERLGLCKVAFNNAAMFLFDSPKKGADLLWEKDGEGDKPNAIGDWAVGRILGTLASRLTSPDGKGRGLSLLSPVYPLGVKLERGKPGPILAPPGYDRPINAQEAETVLCKWKSYLGGHYEIGEDVKHTRAALLRFARCRLSQRLLKAGAKGGLW